MSDSGDFCIFLLQGVWGYWESVTKLVFHQGDACGPAISRSTIVNILCDSNDAEMSLSAIQEYETCKYSMNLKAPIPCSVLAHDYVEYLAELRASEAAVNGNTTSYVVASNADTEAMISAEMGASTVISEALNSAARTDSHHATNLQGLAEYTESEVLSDAKEFYEGYDRYSDPYGDDSGMYHDDADSEFFDMRLDHLARTRSEAENKAIQDLQSSVRLN
jgi:hypothetical protein